MKTCPICETENPIDAHACTACGTALDQYALDEEVERANVAAKKRKLHKKEIWIGLGVIVLVVILINVFTGGPSATRVETEAFYKKFISIDEKEYLNFWKCIQRGIGRTARTMKDNLELYKALEGAYNRNPAAYPKHIRELCIPKAEAFPVKMKEIKLVDSLEPELSEYIKSADRVAAAAEKFASGLQALNDQGTLDKKVEESGYAFHFDSDDSATTYAFDHYLRCAIPEYDEKADTQGIVDYLFSIRQDPSKEVARWRKECAPLLEDTENVKPHAQYKGNVKKLGTDDRDILAFKDLFVRADRKAREDLMHEIMGKAWKDYFNSWQGLKKRLAEALGS